MPRVNATVYTPFIVIALFLVLLLVERLVPLRKSRLALWTRLVVNVTLSLLTYGIAAAVVRPSAMWTLQWSSARPFGLLRLTSIPPWAQLLAGVLLLDLSFYWWHRANHRLPLLWRFHNVHHFDPDLDVSTGLRFHFVEIFFRRRSASPRSACSGSAPAFSAYELAFQANTLFHHSNLRLPIRLERLLNVTGDAAHARHPPLAGRARGDVELRRRLPWWDRLHRTIGLNIPQSRVEIGIAGYSAPQDNGLRQALVMPFHRQRDYWTRSDGSMPERRSEDLQPHAGVLAE